MASFSGTITGGTPNFADGDTIDGDVLFNGSAAVTCDAGATITVTGNFTVRYGESGSQASFTSNATSGSPSFFQHTNHDGTPRGDWVGFDFRESTAVDIRHLRIRDTTTGIHFQGNEITSMVGYIGEDSLQCGLWDPASGAADQSIPGSSTTQPIFRNSLEGIEIATIPSNVVRLSIAASIKFEATVQNGGWILNHAIWTGAGAVWHGGDWIDPEFFRWGFALDWAESGDQSSLDGWIFDRGNTTVPFDVSRTFFLIFGTEPGTLLINEITVQNAGSQTQATWSLDWAIDLDNAVGDINVIFQGGTYEASLTQITSQALLRNGRDRHSIRFFDVVVTRVASASTAFLNPWWFQTVIGPNGSGGTIEVIGCVGDGFMINLDRGEGTRRVWNNNFQTGVVRIDDTPQGAGTTGTDVSIRNNLWQGVYTLAFSPLILLNFAAPSVFEITGNLMELETAQPIIGWAIRFSREGTWSVINNRLLLDGTWTSAVRWRHDDPTVGVATGINVVWRGNEFINTGGSPSGNGFFWLGPLAGDDFRGLLEQNRFENWEDGLLIQSGFVPGDGGFGGRVLCCDFVANTNGIHAVGNQHITAVARIDSNFLGNISEGMKVDVIQAGGIPFNAELSYWNSPSGPSGFGPGTGDSVTDFVDFTPFATAPCEQPAIIVGTVDLGPFFTDPLKLDFRLDQAWEASFDIEDFFNEFTREQLGGKKMVIRFGTLVVFQGWVEIAVPRWVVGEVRTWSITALNAVGKARVKKIPNTTQFNYTSPTDPAEIFRQTIDDALVIALPAELFVHDTATIPDSTQLIIADFRDMPILDVWNELRRATDGRSFWIDQDHIVYFREAVSTAKTLGEDVFEIENPYDETETYNRITYKFDGGTKKVVPLPVNLDSVIETGEFRDWIEEDPAETDADSALAKAEAILARKSEVLQVIKAEFDIDTVTYALRDLITINIPLMELDGIEKEVVAITHILHVDIEKRAGGERFQFGETILSLGTVPLRASDIIGSVQR